jgi:hypothetical protein
MVPRQISETTDEVTLWTRAGARHLPINSE